MPGGSASKRLYQLDSLNPHQGITGISGNSRKVFSSIFLEKLSFKNMRFMRVQMVLESVLILPELLDFVVGADRQELTGSQETP